VVENALEMGKDLMMKKVMLELAKENVELTKKNPCLGLFSRLEESVAKCD